MKVLVKINKVLSVIVVVLLVAGASFLGASLALNNIPTHDNTIFRSLQDLSGGNDVFVNRVSSISPEEKRILLEIADLIRDKRLELISDYDYAFKSGELTARYLALQ